MSSLGADEQSPERSGEDIVVDQLRRVDQALLSARAGDVREALELLRPIAGLRRRGLSHEGRARLTAVLLDCRLARGELAEAERLGEELGAFTKLPRAAASPLAAAVAHLARSLLATAVGDPAGAVEHAEAVPAALATAEAAGDALTGPIAEDARAWRNLAALGMLRAGRVRESAALAREEVERVGETSPYYCALALRTLAATDNGFERTAILRRARESAREAGSARLTAQIGADLAGLLALDPSPAARAEAVDVLRAAEEYAGLQELWPLQSRVRRLLEHLGEEPRRYRDEALDLLSDAERRVAVLACGGMSNRDIALETGTTLKGTEWHLSRVYRKLGIRRRAELARLLGVG